MIYAELVYWFESYKATPLIGFRSKQENMVHSNHPPLAARIIVVLSLSFGLTQLAHTRDQAIDLKVLLGSSWQVKNDVQIPNNAAGTRFSLADNIDEGPLLAARLEANWSINEKQGFDCCLPLYHTVKMSSTMKLSTLPVGLLTLTN